MATPAYVLLGADGIVEKVHSTEIGGMSPSSGPKDLEKLIDRNYSALREIPLVNGKILIVLQKP